MAAYTQEFADSHEAALRTCHELQQWAQASIKSVVTGVSEVTGCPAFRVYVSDTRVGVHIYVPPLQLPKGVMARVLLVKAACRVQEGSMSTGIEAGTEHFACVHAVEWGFGEAVDVVSRKDIDTLVDRAWAMQWQLGEPEDDSSDEEDMRLPTTTASFRADGQ